MEKSKKTSRITMVIIGITMVLGTVGSFPTAYSATPYSDSELPYQGLNEYVFENVIIHDLNVSPKRCRVIIADSPDSNQDGFNFGGFGFELFGSSSAPTYTVLNFEPMPDISETENGQIDRTDALRKKNYSLLSQIKVGSEVTIRVKTDNNYPDLLTENYSNFVYDFEEVVSVTSPGIHLYGDINDDGTVDSYDAITYRKYLSGTTDTKLSYTQIMNGDINLNAKIDEDDFCQVQAFLLGSKTKFNEVSPIGSIRLDNTIDILASDGTVTDDKFASAEMNLGVELLKRCFDPTKQGEENFLVSPLSVSTALAMTANGADGETRDEMEKLLGNGLTIEQINDYMAYYVKTLPDLDKEKVYLANSIWFKDKPEFKVHEEFLEANKKYYSSEIYKSDFDDSTVSDINSWVNTNTKGMIPSILKNGYLDKKGETEPLMMLINTLFFEADWNEAYNGTFKDTFTDLNGDVHIIDKMQHSEYTYFDLGDADAFKKSYINQNYSFLGILPRDNDILGYISSLDPEKLIDSLSKPENSYEFDLTVFMPKFQYSYDTSLKDVLIDMGFSTAFSPQVADFSKINDITVEDAPSLFIDDVIHKTKIEVTEKGTKAAAATGIGMFGGGAGIPKKQIIIDLNRPFVYMIVDNNNVPLFIGAVSMIE